MSERKSALINVSKGMLNISLTALAAIGSATGNIWLAGATAIPGAIVASGTLKPLLEKKQEEYLELPVPPWWTESPQSWQTTCSSIENRLPTIMNSVADRLRKEKTILTISVVRQIFMEEVAHQLPAWEVKVQDRNLVAGYVTLPLLEKSAVVLKTVIDPIREDALADILAKVVTMLDEAQKTKEVVASASSVGATSVNARTPQAPEATYNAQSIAAVLQQKMLKEAYDVYICYHEADETEVFKIGEQLKGHGILPWFDIMDVKPGTPARQQQEQQIERISAAAVFVGQHAVADWQVLQMYSFLEQFVQRECPVIPVLLPDAPKRPKLPVFLANFAWVDFRRQVPDPIGQLIWGITGKRL